MSDTVIRVEGLGKRYRIGAAVERYVALRDVLTRGARRMGRRLLGRGEARPKYEEFWALRDVSFEVRRGECVGIIGRNGAGKSTLLKLLSRITEPTEGGFRMRGRVASLLEVGTGFHPELTGRENVYLNGAILGMSRAEIRRKFDEIVAFAEVEKFLETPVKYYSSGMYMRLAFAVAAHLEPEILVVDEVLAVGDAAFQQKCLGKMGEVTRGGRTVLFVSHNMQTIAHMCNRCVCLHVGRLALVGTVREGIDHYYGLVERSAGTPEAESRREGSGEVRFTTAVPSRNSYRPDEIKSVDFRLRRNDPRVRRLYLSALVFDKAGAAVAHCESRLMGVEVEIEDELEGRFVLKLPWLKPGDYTVDLFACATGLGILDRFERACSLRVLPILPYPAVATIEATSGAPVLADFDWRIGPDAREGT